MVGANGSALPIYEHEQPQRLNDHNPYQTDREIEHHQRPNDLHSLKTDRKNEIDREVHNPISKPPRRVRSLGPARGPKPLLPRSLKEALQLAQLLSKSKLVPKGFENQEACLVGILYGMEVGLSPIAALQRMAIIDGRPTIWGDAALALVEASGLLVKIEERIEILEPQSDHQSSDWPHDGKSSQTGHQRPDQSDDSPSAKIRTAICQVLRSGRSEPIIRLFSIEDAKRAGLWQKPGPWTDYPDRMLMMRARAFALRDAFPDVLMGLYIREEFEGVNSQSLNSYREGKQSDWEENAINQNKIQSDWNEPSNSRTGGKAGDINMISTAGSSNGDRRTSGPNDRERVWHSYQTRDGRDPKLDRSNTIGHSRRRAPPPPMEVDHQVLSRADDQLNAPIDELENNEELPFLSESNDATDYEGASDTLELFDSALGCAKDEETLEEIREEFNGRIDRLESGRLQEAGRIFLRHEKRIRATEVAFKTSSEPSYTSAAKDLSLGGPDLDKSKGELCEINDQLEECEDELLENATGRIGKEPLSPHRRRFSVRPKRGLSLAELNARRKVDLLKYMPRLNMNKDEIDE